MDHADLTGGADGSGGWGGEREMTGKRFSLKEALDISLTLRGLYVVQKAMKNVPFEEAGY